MVGEIVGGDGARTGEDCLCLAFSVLGSSFITSEYLLLALSQT